MPVLVDGVPPSNPVAGRLFLRARPSLDRWAAWLTGATGGPPLSCSPPCFPPRLWTRWVPRRWGALPGDAHVPLILGLSVRGRAVEGKGMAPEGFFFSPDRRGEPLALGLWAQEGGQVLRAIGPSTVHSSASWSSSACLWVKLQRT